jgi:hypothetical protein
MFSQSLLALLLSCHSLPITISVAHVTAELFALPSTMFVIKAHIMSRHIYLIQTSGLPATLSMSSLGYNGVTEELPS